jgi:hypothetical protein
LRKFRYTVKKEMGSITYELSCETENIEEINQTAKAVTETFEKISQEIIKPQEKAGISLEEIVHKTETGPVLTIKRELISDREGIGLIMYASRPNGLKSAEIARLLQASGRFSPGFAARLSEMKREGILVREDDLYKLTTHGIRWVEEHLIPKIKAELARI